MYMNETEIRFSQKKLFGGSWAYIYNISPMVMMLMIMKLSRSCTFGRRWFAIALAPTKGGVDAKRQGSS